MFKVLCCCCFSKSKKETQEPLIKIEDLYEESEPKYKPISDIIENKRVHWNLYEEQEPESKEDYYRMLGEAAFLKQKFIGK